MRQAIAGLVLLAAIAQPAAAQRYWRDTLYPFVYYTTIDKWWFGGRYAVFSPVTDIAQPERHLASFSADAVFSTEGSYRLILLADLPAWWDGWRAGLMLASIRFNRLGYFGLGNTTTFFQDSISPDGPYYYAVSRRSYQVRATLQRDVVGPLRALVGSAYERTSYRTLPGANVFRNDLSAGALDSSQTQFRDLVGRLGLVLDTRDNELDPHQGLFVEALYGTGDGYSRYTVAGRAYVQPIDPLTIAVRAGIETMPGSPPLAPLTVMESSDAPFVALGGYYSLRGYYDGRFAGPGKLLGGIEARYSLLWAPSVLEVKIVGFYDVGRVFAPGETVRLTTDGLHHGAGAEVAARFGRNSLLVGGVGFGSEGAILLFGTTWSY